MRSVGTVGRWSIRHPWLAIVAWLAFVVLAVGSLAATGTESLNNGAVGESERGYTLMDEHEAWPPAREYGYLHSDRLTVDSPAFRSAIAAVRERMGVVAGNQINTGVSADRHSALVVGAVSDFGALDQTHQAILGLQAAHPAITIAETGDIAASDARDHVVNNDLHRAELLSVPVTFLVLLFAFGALVAALVPVLLALTAVGAAIGLLGPVSQLFHLDDSVKIVVVLIGMAVGVDYALFYVIRSREERHRGLDPARALERTAQTSGRTVLVSGSIVAVAMAGMFFIRSSVFNGLASGTMTVIAVAVAGSVTVLPGVLRLLGSRIDRGRIPFLPHLRDPGEPARFWPAVVDRMLLRPVVSCVASIAFLLALAAPAVSLHVSAPGDEALSGKGEPALRTLATIRKEFPVTQPPAVVVAAGPFSSQAAATAAAKPRRVGMRLTFCGTSSCRRRSGVCRACRPR